MGRIGRIHPHTGPKIRFYRELRQWSLRDLARYSGVHFRTICNYERRETPPDYAKTGLIAKALGVSLAHLWDHTAPPDLEIEDGQPPPWR